MQQKSTNSVKPSTKAPSPERVFAELSGDENDQAPDRDEDSGEEDDMHLHGFSTDDDDSSDEENIVDTEFDINISKLPTVAKDDVTFNQKLEKAKRNPVRYVCSGFLRPEMFSHSFFFLACRPRTEVFYISGDYRTAFLKTN